MLRTMAATDVQRMNELVVASWNSRGHRVDRLRYLHRLKHECHVIFVQEHWLFDFELHKQTNRRVNAYKFDCSIRYESK